MKQGVIIVSTFLLFSSFISSCSKYLDKKSDAKLSVPETLKDFQALMDNYNKMNGVYPGACEIICDNYYVSTDVLNAMLPYIRNIYLWQKTDETDAYWNTVYQSILITNVVLEGVEKYSVKDESWDKLEGTALFFRSCYFYSIAQIFASSYDKANAASIPGIFLKLTANQDEPAVRSTLLDSYKKMINDFKRAALLLPERSSPISRPNKSAAYGALARIYLSISEYDSAGYYANKALSIYDSLLNFNELNSTSSAPIKQFNKEVVLPMRSQVQSILVPSRARIDSNLIKSYESGDLRMAICFRKNSDNSFSFKGDYDGLGASNGYVFAGITTSESFLIRAEASARKNDLIAAAKDLNLLLKTRWNNTIPYNDVVFSDQSAAIKRIILERRKELLFRGARWTDMRRIQNNSDLFIIPQRLYAENIYRLEPNSPRFVLQIPINEVNLSGIAQNP